MYWIARYVAASTVNAVPSTSRDPEAVARLEPKATLSSRCGAPAKISRHGIAQTATIANAAREHRARVLAGGSSPRDLRHEVEAGADRHPDQDLGGHGRGGVGAGRVLRELVLGRDQVDVLQHGDHAEAGDRGPRAPEVGPQAERHATVGAAWRERDVLAQLHPAVERHHDVGQERAEVGARHAEEGRREGRAGDQANGLLTDQADADGLVVADALQRPAQDRDLQVHASGRDARRRGPAVLLDPDRLRRWVPEARSTTTVSTSGDDQQHLAPLLDRREQVVADAEVAEDPFAGRCDLHRLPEHGQDQQVADQCTERPVIVELAREHEGRAERDDVVEDHRSGQADRLRRLRVSQPSLGRHQSLS